MMNGLDWRDIGMAEYQTTLAAWNDRQVGEDKPEPDYDRLRRTLAVHTTH